LIISLPVPVSRVVTVPGSNASRMAKGVSRMLNVLTPLPPLMLKFVRARVSFASASSKLIVAKRARPVTVVVPWGSSTVTFWPVWSFESSRVTF
jgi:hypothetical protein